MAERVKQWLLHTLTLHEMWELLRNPRDTIRTDVSHGRLCVCLYVEVLQLLATASLLAVSPMAKKRKRLLQTATLTERERYEDSSPKLVSVAPIERRYLPIENVYYWHIYESTAAIPIAKPS